MICLTRVGHTTKIALGTLTKYQDAYDQQSRWPPRSKIKVISSHRLYVSSLPLLSQGNKMLYYRPTFIIRGIYTVTAKPGGHSSCLTLNWPWNRLGVTQGHWKWHNSIDRSSFYSSSIVSMAVSCIIFKIKWDIGRTKTTIFTARCYAERTMPSQLARCPSVCHTPVFCRHSYTYPETFYTVSRGYLRSKQYSNIPTETP